MYILPRINYVSIIMKKLNFALFALVFLSLIAVNVAANATSVPSTAQSERLSDRLSGRNEPQLKASDEILIKGEDSAAPVEGASEINLTLNEVKVEGNTVFVNGEIEALYADMVGKTITLTDVYVLRDQITKLYREEGYVLSRAILPPQKISEGSVTFRIIEGYLNNITIEGDIQGDKDIIDAYVAKIKAASSPLNSADLERYLLLMNDLHGVTANGVLKPAQNASGAADLAIIIGHNFIDGLIGIDNSGTKFIGEYLVQGQVNVNSALGMYEQISFRTIQDLEFEEIQFYELNYRQPLGNEGTVLELTYGMTDTEPGSTLTSLAIEGDTQIAQIEVTHPFLRSRRENFTGRAQFTFKETETDSLGLNLFKDRTRVLTVGGTYDLADNHGGVNLVDAAVHQGLNIFDATNNSMPKSRGNANAEFTKFTIEASRLQHIDGNLYFLVEGKGQYALDALLVGEEFGIGGDFGRGYDFSELTGDHGAAAKAELQYGIDVDTELVSDVQLYTFYDFGTIWQEDKIAGAQSRQSLASAGVGTRFNMIEDVSGYMQLTQPITRNVATEGDKDPRFHFGLNYLF